MTIKRNGLLATMALTTALAWPAHAEEGDAAAAENANDQIIVTGARQQATSGTKTDTPLPDQARHDDPIALVSGSG